MDASERSRKPKHLQIRQVLEREIGAGAYINGQKIPSEVELAGRFGVSRPTMARALRDLEQGGLLHRRVGDGTYIRQMKHHVFGLLILEVGEIFGPICEGLAQAREGTPHELIWGNVSNKENSEIQAERLCQQYIDRRVSGVFWAPLELTRHNEEMNLRIAKALIGANIPTVLLDRDIHKPPRRSNFDLVGIDHRRAGHVITAHLLELGCRRLVFLARPNSAPTIEARIAGYRDAIHEHGLDREAESVHFGDPQDPDFVRGLLEPVHPEGIVCANDYTAALLMRTLSGMHLRVPQDIRLVGIDDLKYASLVSVPLTTLHQPCRDIGVAALDTMLQRIRHPSAPAREVSLDFNLIVRESSGAELIKQLPAARTPKNSF